jgi:hypothetical protein
MTDVIKISNGTDSVDLSFDASGAGFQMLASGASLGLPEHQHLYHQSDWQDGERIIREKLGNRTWPMKVALKSNSSDDAIANQLITLNRLIKRARRHQTHQDESEVYLEIQLEGATNWTRYTVIDANFGGVDLFEYFNRQTQDVKFGDAISFDLITEPLGYGAWQYIYNELTNPDFYKNTYGWNEVGSPTEFERTTSGVGAISSFVNGTAGLFTTDADGEGIESDTISSNDIEKACVAYAYVYTTDSGTITATLRNHTDGTDITSDTTSTTDEGVKLSLSANVPAEKDVRLRITATSGMTVYVNKCYLQFNSTAISNSHTTWCSQSNISNYDGDSGAVAYIDVHGAPGDAPMETHWVIEGNTFTEYHIGKFSYRVTENANDYNCYDYHISGATDISVSPNTWETVKAHQTTIVNQPDMYPGTYMLLAPMSISSGSVDGKAKVLTSGPYYDFAFYDETDSASTEVVNISLSTTSQMIAIGPIYFGMNPDDHVSLIPEGAGWPGGDYAVDYQENIRVLVNLESAATVTADFFLLVSVDEEYTIFNAPDDYATCFIHERNGVPMNMVLKADGAEGYIGHYAILGQVPQIEPDIMQRFVITSTNSDDGFSQGSVKVYIKARPRTEFLLGTS